MFTTKNEIKSWLDSMDIAKYIIHDDLTVDVDGDVDIRDNGLLEIPVQFSIVNGNFSCAHNKLTSLKGSPYVVEGSFDCSNNQLNSLDYSPSEVHGTFMFQENKVTSLKDGPNIVSGEIMCGRNPIKNFDGIENISAYGLYHWAPNKTHRIEGLELYYDKGVNGVNLNINLNRAELNAIKAQRELHMQLSIELNNPNHSQKKVKV